jgi:hypothetical protein
VHNSSRALTLFTCCQLPIVAFENPDPQPSSLGDGAGHAGLRLLTAGQRDSLVAGYAAGAAEGDPT